MDAWGIKKTIKEVIFHGELAQIGIFFRQGNKMMRRRMDSHHFQHGRPRGRAMATTARQIEPTQIPLGNLPPATGKCLSPRDGQAHSWKRGSAAPADRHFPEDLGISLAWAAARCLLGIL